MLHVNAQNELQDIAITHLSFPKNHQFSRVICISKVTANPEHPRSRREVEQQFKTVIGGFLRFTIAQLGIGNGDLLIFQQFLSAEIELLHIKCSIGRFSVFPGNLMLPARGIFTAIELQQLRFTFGGPEWIEPRCPAEHLELFRQGQPIVGGVSQAVGGGIDFQAAACFQALSESLPCSLGKPRAFIYPNPVYMKRAECIAIRTGRTEIDHGAIGKLQSEVWLPGDFGFAVFRDGNAVHQIFIVVQLILDFFNYGVEMSLMRSGDQSLSAASREGIVQCIR